MLSIKELEERLRTVTELKKKFEGTYTNDYILDNQSVFTITGIKKANWFISNNYSERITIDKNESLITIKQGNKEGFYISYLEKNINFSIPPSNKNIKINPNKLYNILFSGEVHGGLKVELYVICYSNKDKEKTHLIKIGQKRQVRISSNTTSIRVAMKFIGEGNLVLSKIDINENHLPKFIDTTTAANKIDRFIEYTKKNTNNKNFVEPSYKIKIMSILDEFSHEAFKYECDLLPISTTNWAEVLEKEKPQLLLVESAWNGNSGLWKYKIANLHINYHPELEKLIKACKKNKIPTVFFDKEGKDNFNFFKKAISLFDYIFVTDENNIENISNVVKHNRVFPISFAAQPRIHNPIDRNGFKLGKVSFSGSWYGDKHPERVKDVENIVKPAIDFGLDIFDRFYGSDNQKQLWPELYQSSIVGKLEYHQMIAAYKNYDIFLNVNSVQNSKYMFSRRVYEILACKTMVLSGESLGVREQFADYVYMSNSAEETTKILKILLKNKMKLEREAKLAHRYVMENHTYRHRIEEIFDNVGLVYEKKKRPSISTIVVTNRQQFIDNIYENLKQQVYDEVEHIIILNSNDMKIKEWRDKFSTLKNTRIFQCDEEISLGNCLNFGISKAKNEVIAKIDDDDYYAPNYLYDMVLTFEYTDADIVGKSSHYVYLENQKALLKKTVGSGEDRYSKFISGATLVFKKSIVDIINGFEDRSLGEDTAFLKAASNAGLKIYSNDAFNFCLIRRADKKNHTWKIDDSEILKVSETCAYTEDFKTFVTI